MQATVLPTFHLMLSLEMRDSCQKSQLKKYRDVELALNMSPQILTALPLRRLKIYTRMESVTCLQNTSWTPAMFQIITCSGIQSVAGKHKHIKSVLQKTKVCVVHCYHGDHNQCKKHSFVCKGDKSKNWINRSTYLPNDFKLQCTKQDMDKLHQFVDYRLSEKMLDRTKLLLNTQKAEAYNRALISKPPKSVTFTGNRKARIHCT